MNVHDIAQRGFGTGTNELYDRARPSYQSSALEYIRKAIPGDVLNVAEIGSGTGIFTRALLAHPAWTSSVAKLEAVEPSTGMREVFEKSLAGESRVSCREGTFSASGLPTAWADVVFVAQALHWCPDFDAAAAEFSRILKPKGSAVFIWNLEDRLRMCLLSIIAPLMKMHRDAAEWVAQVRERIERHEEGTPQFRLMKWRAIYETPNYKALFNIPDEQTWANELPATADIVVNRALSKSYITILPDQEKEVIERDIRRYIAEGKGLTKSAEIGGDFVYPYKTWVVVAQKQI